MQQFICHRHQLFQAGGVRFGVAVVGLQADVGDGFQNALVLYRLVERIRQDLDRICAHAGRAVEAYQPLYPALIAQLHGVGAKVAAVGHPLGGGVAEDHDATDVARLHGGLGAMGSSPDIRATISSGSPS